MKSRILIVEDAEENLELFREVLRISGYDVLWTGDGISAVEIARTQRPDLILMDIQLPGLDGHEATRRIRQLPGISSVPIIAVTAHAMLEDREKALQAGCSAYLPKPISPRVLLQTIAEHLRRAESPQ